MEGKEVKDDEIDHPSDVIVIDLLLQDEEEEAVRVGSQEMMISNLVDDPDQEIFRHLVVDIVGMTITGDVILDLEVLLLDIQDLPVVQRQSLLRLHYLSKMILIGISLSRVWLIIGLIFIMLRIYLRTDGSVRTLSLSRLEHQFQI